MMLDKYDLVLLNSEGEYELVTEECDLTVGDLIELINQSKFVSSVWHTETGALRWVGYGSTAADIERKTRIYWELRDGI